MPAKVKYGLTWIRSPNQLADDLQIWADKDVFDRISRNADKVAADITEWLQNNTPWTDRTGEARLNMRCVVEHEPGNIHLVSTHGMPYGIYLETMQSGRFSVLMPMLGYWGPRFVKDILG